MSIIQLSDDMLEQVSGGFIFRPDENNQPQEWEVISDYDGSVLAKVHGTRADAQAKAAELNQSKSTINWHSLDSLRRLASGRNTSV